MSGWAPAALLGAYVAALFAVSIVARRRTKSADDYLVAGRRLGMPLASVGLLATWFGAGTLIASADEVRATGLVAAALEPIGPGLCLVVVGLFYAAPLRRLRLLTLGDFFRDRFGPGAELAAALIMVPSFFGWIAAQFSVIAALLGELFGMAPTTAVVLVAAVAIGYTMIGGMWSVTLTDAAQMAIVVAGLLALAASAVVELGGGGGALAGVVRLGRETPPDLLALVPAGGAALLGWIGLLLSGALGNVPGQDVMQRVFAARSPGAARGACLIAGGAYLALGAIPVILGLASRLLLPAGETEIIAGLGRVLFSPLAGLMLILVIVSAVLSTLDSALMAAGSVLAKNILWRAFPRAGLLGLGRVAVLIVGAASLLYALRDMAAYALLEDAYELTLVGLFMPLTMGLFTKRGGSRAALVSMGAGAGLWVVHAALGWSLFLEPALAPAGAPVPTAIGLTAMSALGYLLFAGSVGRPSGRSGARS